MNGSIYKITCKLNNKVYIGQTIRNIEDRWKQHLKDSKQAKYKHSHFYRAMNKYGSESFSIETIDLVESEDINELKEILNKLERFYISNLNSFKKGYNSSWGGEGNLGLKHTEESKEKMRQANLGKSVPDHVRKKISESSIKYYKENPLIMTDEWIKNSSRAHKKQIVQLSLKGDFIKLWDGAVDVESELGINHANITKCCCIDKIQYQSAGNFIWQYNDDYIKGVEIQKFKNKGARKVICTTTNEIFDSLRDAGKKYNIFGSNITLCCQGKNKSSGVHPVTKESLVWMYLEDYENKSA